MNTVTWKMQKDELGRVKYIGSNGVVINRKGLAKKVWMGRNRSKPSKGYYQVNDKGYYLTLKDAKQAAEKVAA